ncbi:MAG: Bug family tripartite tricarboxylate transporter substrate binding protein [Hyphomicrobiales bacterium]
MRRFVAPVLGAIALFAASPAVSAEIPCSTAKLIVPWGAGGDTDVLFRAFVNAANEAGAKPQLQVVNIGGQGGNKGAKEAKAAAADGCTLFAIHQSAITSYFNGRVDFAWDAFEPVTLLTRTPAIIGANPGTPYKDAKEMVEAAKKAPGTITAGGTAGSTSHFIFLILEDAAGIKLKHVPYEGTRERMTALLAKNIELGEINLAAAQKYITTNELKALGIASDARDPSLPDVPTLKEQGIDMIFATDRGVVAPKGTPKEVIAHYDALFQKAAKDPKLLESMKVGGTQVMAYGPDKYKAYMDDIFARWKKVAEAVGMLKR